MKKLLLIVYLAGFVIILPFGGYLFGEGARFTYDAKGKRDPLVPLIGLPRSAIIAKGLSGATSIEGVKLEGIAISPNGRHMAILNGDLAGENDKFGLVTVKRITKDSVKVSIDGVEHTLNLIEEEGAPK